jgi:hypothetical protein
VRPLLRLRWLVHAVWWITQNRNSARGSVDIARTRVAALTHPVPGGRAINCAPVVYHVVVEITPNDTASAWWNLSADDLRTEVLIPFVNRQVIETQAVRV